MIGSLHRRLAALALPLALLALPALAQDWTWAEGKTIAYVEFTPKLETMNPAEAQDLIETRQGRAFSAEVLAADLGRLYRSGRFGSPAPGVPPVSVVVRVEGAGVGVVFTVKERPRVRRVVVEDGDVIDKEKLDEAQRLKAGDLVDPFAVESDLRRLRQALLDAGYLESQVVARLEPRESGIDVFYVVRAGPRVVVDDIEYVGAEQLDPSIMEDATGVDALETKEESILGFVDKGVFKPDGLRRDCDRISRWYRSQGFLDARVYPLEEKTSLDGAEITVRIGVEEGVRYHVRRVGITGTTVLPEDRLLREVPLRTGRPFLGDDLRASMDKIRRLYGQRAYIHCEVDVDVRYDVEHHLIDIELQVTEGPLVRIDEVRIEANDKTREEVIRRELSVYPGELVDGDQIEASMNRLGRLRYFGEGTRVDFEPGSAPGKEDLVIRVEETRTGSFNIGGGISTGAGFFGNLSVNLRNFDIRRVPSWLADPLGRGPFGGGQELNITLSPGRQRSQYSIEFVEPWLLGYPVILGLEGFARDRTREDWLEQHLGGRGTLGYRLRPDLIARLTYSFERVRVGDIEESAVPDVLDVAGTSYVASLKGSITWDQNLIDPDYVYYGGYATSAYYEWFDRALGSDYDFYRAGASANWQTTFFRWPRQHKWVFGLHGDVSYQQSRDGDPIPIFERFFAGGPQSLRGFRFRSANPQLGNKPLGGDFTALFGVEASYPLFQNFLRGVVFIDAGGVVSRARDFDDEDNLRVAAGVGVRLRVPVFPAPVALDFAWPLRKTRFDDPQVFSFSVGFGFQ